MIKEYWTLFWLYLIGIIIFIVMCILSIIFIKKIFLNKKGGIALFIISLLFIAILEGVSIKNFVLCCKDYTYVSNNAYIEEKAKFVGYYLEQQDPDGKKGQLEYFYPKFYLIDKDEYIFLSVNTKDIEIDAIVIVRYFPNTRLCEIVEEL